MAKKTDSAPILSISDFESFILMILAHRYLTFLNTRASNEIEWVPALDSWKPSDAQTKFWNTLILHYGRVRPLPRFRAANK